MANDKIAIDGFSKQERHEIYKKALELYEQEKMGRVGLCYCLSWSLPNTSSALYVDVYNQIHFDRCFPEIAKRRPHRTEGRYSYWFPLYEWRNRVAILEGAIEETKS